MINSEGKLLASANRIEMKSEKEGRLTMAASSSTKKQHRHFAGPAAALGAAVGILFGLLLGKSTAVGIFVGSALGFLLGASVDAVRARQ